MKINSVLTAAVGSLVLLSGCDKKVQQTRDLPAVVVEPAVEMEFADSVTEVGEVKAYDTVGLSANVSGFLTEANFKEGELVKKGVKLFQIDPSVYDAAVKKAEADVNKYHAELVNKDIEFKRQQQMLKTNATSKRSYDSAEMNLRTAKAELKSAEATLAEKKVDLGYTKITAPFDGYIGFKKYSVGNMVGPSSGALAVITAAGNVKIYFSMYERSLQVRLESFLKVCDAIEYSHSRGIIHCDLKPENIMLGKNGEVYVMDWGIACPDGTDRRGSLDGTPAYMAPEIFENGIANPQTDVFALGMILNEIVTLRKSVSGARSEEHTSELQSQ